MGFTYLIATKIQRQDVDGRNYIEDCWTEIGNEHSVYNLFDDARFIGTSGDQMSTMFDQFHTNNAISHNYRPYDGESIWYDIQVTALFPYGL